MDCRVYTEERLYQRIGLGGGLGELGEVLDALLLETHALSTRSIGLAPAPACRMRSMGCRQRRAKSSESVRSSESAGCRRGERLTHSAGEHGPVEARAVPLLGHLAERLEEQLADTLLRSVGITYRSSRYSDGLDVQVENEKKYCPGHRQVCSVSSCSASMLAKRGTYERHADGDGGGAGVGVGLLGNQHLGVALVEDILLELCQTCGEGNISMSEGRRRRVGWRITHSLDGGLDGIGLLFVVGELWIC